MLDIGSTEIATSIIKRLTEADLIKINQVLL